MGVELPIDSIEIETIFVRGEVSNYILESDYSSLKLLLPNSSVITAKNAGHWVHAEAPQFFYEEVLKFFEE